MLRSFLVHSRKTVLIEGLKVPVPIEFPILIHPQRQEKSSHFAQVLGWSISTTINLVPDPLYSLMSCTPILNSFKIGVPKVPVPITFPFF